VDGGSSYDAYHRITNRSLTALLTTYYSTNIPCLLPLIAQPRLCTLYRIFSGQDRHLERRQRFQACRQDQDRSRSTCIPVHIRSTVWYKNRVEEEETRCQNSGRLGFGGAKYGSSQGQNSHQTPTHQTRDIDRPPVPTLHAPSRRPLLIQSLVGSELDERAGKHRRGYLLNPASLCHGDLKPGRRG
jgi:hypothetical protein